MIPELDLPGSLLVLFHQLKIVHQVSNLILLIKLAAGDFSHSFQKIEIGV